jgi:hypothetical protein
MSGSVTDASAALAAPHGIWKSPTLLPSASATGALPRRHKRIHRDDAELPILVDEQTPEQRCALMSSTFQRLGEVNWRF